MSNGLLGCLSDVSDTSLSCERHVSDTLLDRRSDSLLVCGRDASGAFIGCWLRD